VRRDSGAVPLKKKCVLFFVRNPERGTVKTRLAQVMGKETARELYRHFILDMLSGFEKADCPIIVCYYPKDALDDIKKVVGEGYVLKPQQGGDLGERMEQGMADALALGFDRVLLTGSDIPDLSVAFIDEAFAALESYDTVIGPALDGGYYLIGFKEDSFLPDVFKGIEWGTDTVLTVTLAILAEYRHSVHLLPALTDIDTVEDLKTFFRRHRGTKDCPRTMSCLSQLYITT